MEDRDHGERRRADRAATPAASDRGRTTAAEMEIVRGLGGASIARIASDQLMKGQREIIIQHGRDEYRLRVTAAGKLILTK